MRRLGLEVLLSHPPNEGGTTSPPSFLQWLGCSLGPALRGAAVVFAWLAGWDYFGRPALEADGTASEAVLSAGDILSRVGAGVSLTWIALRPLRPWLRLRHRKDTK